MILTEAEVFERVASVLADALALNTQAITPEASIMDDLNAESIDLLDLRFRVERAFGIRITAEDLAAAFQGATDVSQFRAAFTVQALCEYISFRLQRDGKH